MFRLKLFTWCGCIPIEISFPLSLEYYCVNVKLVKRFYMIYMCVVRFGGDLVEPWQPQVIFFPFSSFMPLLYDIKLLGLSDRMNNNIYRKRHFLNHDNVFFLSWIGSLVKSIALGIHRCVCLSQFKQHPSKGPFKFWFHHSVVTKAVTFPRLLQMLPSFLWKWKVQWCMLHSPTYSRILCEPWKRRSQTQDPSII